MRDKFFVTKNKWRNSIKRNCAGHSQSTKQAFVFIRLVSPSILDVPSLDTPPTGPKTPTYPSYPYPSLMRRLTTLITVRAHVSVSILGGVDGEEVEERECVGLLVCEWDEWDEARTMCVMLYV